MCICITKRLKIKQKHMINDRRYGISWFYVTTRKEQKTYICGLSNNDISHNITVFLFSRLGSFVFSVTLCAKKTQASRFFAGIHNSRHRT